MNRWIRFSGVVGLVLLGFSVIGVISLSAFLGSVGLGVEAALQNVLLLAHFAAGLVLVTAWFVLAGAKSLGAAGAAVSGRTARFSYNAVSYLVVFAGILIVVNWFVNRHDKRWDLTREGVYSLAPQSRDVVQSLTKPLKLVGLSGPLVARLGRDAQEIKELFELYRYANSAKVSYELFDPQAKPHLVEKYGYKGQNLIYLEYGEGEKKAVSRIDEANENAVTNAIIKLQRGEAKKIYYVTGHEEPNLKSMHPEGLGRLAEAIANEHLTIDELLLGQAGSIPADAAAVLLVAPRRPLMAAERDALIKYVEAGGHLLLLPDRRMTVNDPAFEDMRALADHFGIEVGNEVVLDRVARLFAAPAIGAQPLLQDFGYHAITKDFVGNQQRAVVFNIAATVKPKGKSEGGVTYTELLKSGKSAWGESNLAGLFAAEPFAELDDKDVKGPVSMGVVYEKKLTPPQEAGKTESVGDEKGDEKSARVVVIGDADWLLNGNLAVYFNKDLALNCVSWLAGETAGVSIRSRSIKESTAPIEEGTFLKILTASFLIPELILLFGLVVWWRRRTAPMRAA